jgi:hypothetical protein
MVGRQGSAGAELIAVHRRVRARFRAQPTEHVQSLTKAFAESVAGARVTRAHPSPW